jgi:hypothetical protein
MRSALPISIWRHGGFSPPPPFPSAPSSLLMCLPTTSPPPTHAELYSMDLSELPPADDHASTRGCPHCRCRCPNHSQEEKARVHPHHRPRCWPSQGRGASCSASSAKCGIDEDEGGERREEEANLETKRSSSTHSIDGCRNQCIPRQDIGAASVFVEMPPSYDGLS